MFLQACLQIARQAREGGYSQRVAVVYDEMIRKNMAEQAEKNDPTFTRDGDKLHRIDKLILDKAIKAESDRFSIPAKGKGKGKDGGKGSGKSFGKNHFGKDHGKGQKGYDNRQNNYNSYDNRGEKRTLPWQKEHYDNSKKWKGSGRK